MISQRVLLVSLFSSALGGQLEEGIPFAESLRGCGSRMGQGGNKATLDPFHIFPARAAHTGPFLQGLSSKRCRGTPSQSCFCSGSVAQTMFCSTVLKDRAEEQRLSGTLRLFLTLRAKCVKRVSLREMQQELLNTLSQGEKLVNASRWIQSHRGSRKMTRRSVFPPHTPQTQSLVHTESNVAVVPLHGDRDSFSRALTSTAE